MYCQQFLSQRTYFKLPINIKVVLGNLLETYLDTQQNLNVLLNRCRQKAIIGMNIFRQTVLRYVQKPKF